MPPRDRELLTIGEFERTIQRVESTWTLILNRLENSIREGFNRVNGQLGRHDEEIQEGRVRLESHDSRLDKMEEWIEAQRAFPPVGFQAQIVPPSKDDPNVIKIVATKTLVAGIGVFVAIVNIAGYFVLEYLLKKFGVSLPK